MFLVIATCRALAENSPSRTRLSIHRDRPYTITRVRNAEDSLPYARRNAVRRRGRRVVVEDETRERRKRYATQRTYKLL